MLPLIVLPPNKTPTILGRNWRPNQGGLRLLKVCPGSALDLRWAKTRVLKTDTRVSKTRVLKTLACRNGFWTLLSNGRQRVGAF